MAINVIQPCEVCLKNKFKKTLMNFIKISANKIKQARIECDPESGSTKKVHKN